MIGNDRRAEEIRQVFEKSGYPGYPKKDAKDKEATMRRPITPCLAIKMLHSCIWNEPPTLGSNSIFSSSTRSSIVFALTLATPTCCTGSGCRSDNDIPILKQAKAESASGNRYDNSYPQIYPQGTVPTVIFSDLAAPAENSSR